MPSWRALRKLGKNWRHVTGFANSPTFYTISPNLATFGGYENPSGEITIYSGFRNVGGDLAVSDKICHN